MDIVLYTEPLCFGCKHFLDDRKYKCKAFPDGIPNEIIYSDFDHHKNHKDDNGIKFEKKG